MDGLAVVIKSTDAVFPPYFVPSSLTGWALEHHLDTQQARILLEKKERQTGLTATTKIFCVSSGLNTALTA